MLFLAEKLGRQPFQPVSTHEMANFWKQLSFLNSHMPCQFLYQALQFGFALLTVQIGICQLLYKGFYMAVVGSEFQDRAFQAFDLVAGWIKQSLFQEIMRVPIISELAKESLPQTLTTGDFELGNQNLQPHVVGLENFSRVEFLFGHHLEYNSQASQCFFQHEMDGLQPGCQVS